MVCLPAARAAAASALSSAADSLRTDEQNDCLEPDSLFKGRCGGWRVRDGCGCVKSGNAATEAGAPLSLRGLAGLLLPPGRERRSEQRNSVGNASRRGRGVVWFCLWVVAAAAVKCVCVVCMSVALGVLGRDSPLPL